MERISSLKCLNRNVMVAVDVLTTGPTPGYHDIIEVSIVPINADLKPYMEDIYLPFYANLKPRRKENANYDEKLNISRERVCKSILSGLDPDIAADLLDTWFERFDLPFNKRLSPLGHNWALKREFLIDWLGRKSFDRIFDWRYRDIMTAALYMNDNFEFISEHVQFSKYNLRYLASTYKVETISRQDTLANCITIAEVYRIMCVKHMVK